jgi:hypothetical protein
MTTVPMWAWVATFAVLAVLIVTDLVLTRRAGSGLRAAAAESALWLAAAPVREEVPVPEQVPVPDPAREPCGPVRR